METHNQKEGLLLFGSKMAPTIIGVRLFIAFRTLEKGLPFIWVHFSQFLADSLSIMHMLKCVFYEKKITHKYFQYYLSIEQHQVLLENVY